jgi:hypothetical protein
MHRKTSKRQRRPGRRPPYRFRSRHGVPRAEGFKAPGMIPVYKIPRPQLRGTARKALFNHASALTLVLFMVLGALLGAQMLGPSGGILGSCVGLTGGGRFLLKERYDHP